MTSQNRAAGQVSRRDMLKAMQGCAALTSTSMLSTLLNLRMTNTVMADVPSVSGYKAMVCLFLYGGMDSFNLLMPRQVAEYDKYSVSRGNLAIPRNEQLGITSGDGRAYGLHPGVARIRQMFNGGDLAFVSNVGALRERTTLQTFQNGSNLPLGLFSHNDQQQHWQTSVPQSRSQLTGWAGRMADCLTDASNNNPNVSMNISLGAVNILQTGDGVIPYVIGTGGATTVAGFNESGVRGELFTRNLNSMLDHTYGELLSRTHATSRKTARDAAVAFNDSIATATQNVTWNTPFPATATGQQLRMVAETIAARGLLDQKRQTFFVGRGGWDHHDNLLESQELMLPEISEGMFAFNQAMKQLGVHNDVTLFTASDFGRTLTTNGDGSDHAWGGNQIVMGGAVNGGNVLGEYPTDLAIGNPLDTGRGRLIPTTSVDELAAELAMWFGVPNDSNLVDVLPNVRQFVSAGSTASPLGIFS